MLGFKYPFWEAVGIIGGMIIGSGMFALPYAVSVSGFWGAIIGASVALFAVLSLHLAYGEIVVNTREQHRLPGYTRLYLGRIFGWWAKATQPLFFNVALLVYGSLGGVFLSTIFGGDTALWSIVFFTVSAIVLLTASIEKIGFLNFVLSIPLVGATLLIAYLAYNSGSISNIVFADTDPFFAFGIFIFSFTGLSVIADARAAFHGSNVRKLKSAICVGTLIPPALYIVFVVAVLMASGASVSTDSLSGLTDILGKRAVILGAIVGLLAMFTSHIAVGFDLKEIYELDLGMNRFLSWVLVAAIPVLFFLIGARDFIKLISISGGVFIALDGLLVIFIFRKMRRSVAGFVQLIPLGFTYQAVLVMIFIASVVYEIVYHIL